MDCQCEKAGYCERYGKSVTERDRQCCARVSGLPRHKEDCVIALLMGKDCANSVRAVPRTEPLTLAEKARNFATAVKRHALNGFKMVTEEEQRARVYQCEHGHPSGDGSPCPSLREDRSCFECGCPVDEKTWWQTEWCPLGKWRATAGGGSGCGGCGGPKALTVRKLDVLDVGNPQSAPGGAVQGG